ncbi:MAG: signal recognition particle-docking protein FtsY [Candidatus Woesearchaeota archaeon]
MFKFLKEKLKEAVSKFSKKIEEEIDEKEQTQIEKKEDSEKEEIEKKEKKEKDKKEKEVKELKEESTKRSEEKKEEEIPEQKKTFFERLKEKLTIKKIPKAEIEKDLEKAKELEEEIKEEEKIEEEIEKEIKEEKSKTKKSFEEKKETKEKKEIPVKKHEEKIKEHKEHIEQKILEEQKELKKSKETEVEKEEKQEKIKEKESFGSKIRDIFTKKELTAEQFERLFWDLEVALLENNVALEVVEKIKNDLKKELVGKKLMRGKIAQEVINALNKSIEEALSVENFDIIKLIKSTKDKPFVIVFLGINGSGKTTTIAKIAYALKQQKITSVIAASDTFRAAAIQQLEHHANKLDIKLIKHNYGADAAAVAYDAIEYAKAHKIDVVLIDTAGRLHSNKNLMEELKKIVRVTKPNLKIFVGESITGNDCVEQAKTFNEEIGIDGIILTKADVDEKGGAALSMSYITKKPILYLGTGQNYEDLEVFNPKKTAQSIIS